MGCKMETDYLRQQMQARSEEQREQRDGGHEGKDR